MALTLTDVTSTDLSSTEAGIGAHPASPIAYPGLMYPGQTTSTTSEVLTDAVESWDTLASTSASPTMLSPTSSTKGTLTPA